MQQGPCNVVAETIVIFSSEGGLKAAGQVDHRPQLIVRPQFIFSAIIHRHFLPDQWWREAEQAQRLGFRRERSRIVRLMPPAYVKPYVKRGKEKMGRIKTGDRYLRRLRVVGMTSLVRRASKPRLLPT